MLGCKSRTPLVVSPGLPALTIKFTPLGTNRITALTTTYRSTPTRTRYLGVVIDGALQQAPKIIGTVTNETRLGGFSTIEEVEDLSILFQFGAFPVQLRLEFGSAFPAAATTAD